MNNILIRHHKRRGHVGGNRCRAGGQCRHQRCSHDVAGTPVLGTTPVRHRRQDPQRSRPSSVAQFHQVLNKSALNASSSR
jgi:hypothetical protein